MSAAPNNRARLTLFSFSLLGHYYYCCNIRSLQLFNERKSSQDYYQLCTTTMIPGTGFKLLSPGLLLPIIALLMVHLCFTYIEYNSALDFSVPGLLSSTVRLYILHHIPFRQQQYMLLLHCLMIYLTTMFLFRCFSGVPAWRLIM